MTLYCSMIDLKQDAKALAFASALEGWMTYLLSRGMIRSWKLYRRKLNLAADSFRDFMLEIEVEDLAQLDRAFRQTGQGDDEARQLYDRVHAQISDAGFALYRPYPDPEKAERMALV